MKKLIIALSLVISSVSFADDCSSAALDIAKMNLDQVARSYGFESSDIDGVSSKVEKVSAQVTKETSEVLNVYTVNGYVYKASYTVKVILDSLCAVHNLSIKDDSTL
ncbi:hypothetical protein SHI21_09650 [Bacteriovorax sp. PP10]|uniref:PepSY domain-containing protein n=1 Tax=Bacteriovorax antarcticus TaxID=3088717 RepID=A0ABU5VVQ0_9BACT|nr:hypothetical protein [Bacteriovorax sp. PP10]MEA9356468.1 hypothetical protein [Bacteriovorax sp. PP10]